MKLVDGAGQEYKVHFRYGKYDGRRTTACTLHVAPCLTQARPCGTVPCGLGHAACSHQDEFKKVTGRKLALARAMLALKLERPVRAQLWVSYLSQVGQ